MRERGKGMAERRRGDPNTNLNKGTKERDGNKGKEIRRSARVREGETWHLGVRNSELKVNRNKNEELHCIMEGLLSRHRRQLHRTEQEAIGK